MQPLNQTLFRALERRFERVEIANPGARAIVSYEPYYDPRSGKRRMTVRVTDGEQYKVNCCFCSDTRMRLYFSYLWGTRDERTGSQLLHLAHCFNEECVDTREKQLQLLNSLHSLYWERLRARREACLGISSASPAPAPEEEVPVVVEPVEMPLGCSAKKGRIQSSEARRYLRSRGFDPRELERAWRVSYCEFSDNPAPRVVDRIVIPIFGILTAKYSATGKLRTKLVGWQARAIGEVEKGEPKYLTCRGMKKTQQLYGLPQALETKGPIVICEGVTDVWRLRTNAVAIFGKELSRHQEALLLEHFQGRPLVVFLDRDARQQAEKVVQQLRTRRALMDDEAVVAIGRHPKGLNDIGDCTYAEAWKRVARALEMSVDELGLRRRKAK